MSEIITAAITGCVTLLGVLLSNRAAQAVTDEKLTELTREVREHNHFARRVPVVEEQIRGMDRRLEQLEQGAAASAHLLRWRTERSRNGYFSIWYGRRGGDHGDLLPCGLDR